MFKNFINNIIKFQSQPLLSFVSFIESIFFPIPADVLLIPMSIKNPNKWKYLALLTTVSSVIGGVVGYILGVYLFEEIYPYIIDFGYRQSFDDVQTLFIEHGILILFISSFTPLPYKIFVIAAGFLSVNLFLFILISIIGRGLRFYLVSYVSKQYGLQIFNIVNRYFLYIAVFIIIAYILVIKV
tara:strand:+ start:29 stop:580 length:552 start_codon:yes stop_codon:yes gene_type:complete